MILSEKLPNRGDIIVRSVSTKLCCYVHDLLEVLPIKRIPAKCKTGLRNSTQPTRPIKPSLMVHPLSRVFGAIATLSTSLDCPSTQFVKFACIVEGEHGS